MKTLHCYLRVSSESQVTKDLSIPSQKDLAIKKAKVLGMTPVFYIEKGKSSYTEDNLEKRVEMQKLLTEIKEGRVTDLFAYDFSRISRYEVTTAIILGSLKKAKVILHTENSRIDLNNPNEKLQAGILNEFTKFETDVRLARFKLGYMEANRKGRYLGHNYPFGYYKSKEAHNKGMLLINEEEKQNFLKMVKWYLDGEGTDTIAKRLNALGVQTRTQTHGKPKGIWNPGTVLSMFKNPLYMGKRIYNGETVDCPALIDEETWNKIQARCLENRLHSVRSGEVRFYLLKGLLKCGVCGRNYFGKIKEKSGERLYCCLSKRNMYETCANKSINIDRVEIHIWRLVRDTKQYMKTFIDKYKAVNNIDELNEELKQLKKSLEIRGKKLSTLILTPTPTSDTAADIYFNAIKVTESEMAVLEKDIKKIEAKLNSIQVRSKGELYSKVITGDLVKMSEEEKRDLIKNVIDFIVVEYDKEKNVHHLTTHLLDVPEELSVIKTTLTNEQMTPKRKAALLKETESQVGKNNNMFYQWVIEQGQEKPKKKK